MVLVTPGVLTTTAQHIEGRPVREYLGIVSGDAVIVARPPGRRSRLHTARVQRGRRYALRLLARRASARGATVVLAIEFSYLSFGAGTMLVTATGTAVRL